MFHWHVIHEDIYQKLGNLCQQGNETACFISNVRATTKYWLRVLAPCSMQVPSLPARNCLGKKIEKKSFKGRPAARKRRLWQGWQWQVLSRLTLILTNYIFREGTGKKYIYMLAVTNCCFIFLWLWSFFQWTSLKNKNKWGYWCGLQQWWNSYNTWHIQWIQTHRKDDHLTYLVTNKK